MDIMIKNNINTLVSKHFNTPLGTITCSLISNFREISIYDNLNNKKTSSSYNTEAFSIKLYEKDKLPNQLGLNAIIWIWELEKLNYNNEIFRIECSLDSSEKVEYDYASGERLESVEIKNSDWIMNIGTEDYDTQKQYAKSIKTYIALEPIYLKGQRGLFTETPQLNKGDKVYFQVVVSYIENNHHEINTWIDVNQDRNTPFFE